MDGGPLTSTPVSKVRRVLLPAWDEMLVDESTSFVDITGNSSSYKIVNDTVVIDREDIRSASSSDSDSEDDCSSNVSLPLSEIDQLEDAIAEVVEDKKRDDTSSESEDEDQDIPWEDDIELAEVDEMDELDASTMYDVIDALPPTLAAQEIELGPTQAAPTTPKVETTSRSMGTQTEGQPSTKPAIPKHVPQYGPHQKFSRKDEEGNYTEELGLIKGTKVICSLDLLIQQLAGPCKHPGCIHQTTIDYSLSGTSAMIRWKCPTGHKGQFCTSGSANNVLSNNLQAAASVLVSGNNFAKVEKFAKFLGLSFISASTFQRVQKLYCIPAIEEWWQNMREELIVEFKDGEVIVCGDGQCDSPGFSAKNLCYFLMEEVTSYILEVEVLDKRHAGMKSSTMEKKALDNALHRLKRVLNITELCTDASSTIKLLIATEFKEIFHSLDVWHKAKSIRKGIQKVATLRGNGKILEWSPHIINHFWYCCSLAAECDNDVKALEVLKDTWLSLLNHVCNDHEWVTGKCGHEALTPDDEHPPWFDRRDKDFDALQKVILEPTLLDSFKFYVRFRHTGALECANSMSLGYAPKRTAYKYKVYKARKELTAIDWNYHINRPVAKGAEGEARYSRRYNQRTKEWNTRTIKESKNFEYVPVLMAKIFRKRFEDIAPIDRHVSLSGDDPERIAPTIAHKPPLSSKELYTRHQTRFEKK